MTEPALAVRPIPELLAALRERGVRQGIEPIAAQPIRPAISSGQTALDGALRTGGWPRGALAMLDAPGGTGATSLAIGSLAACQAAGGLAAWVDLEGSFDAATAARLGVRLEWLLIVRPADAAEAVELAAWLARSRLIDVLVLDLLAPSRVGSMMAPRAIERLGTLLARTGGIGLLLPGAPHRDVAARTAGIRVALERRAWLAVGSDIVGQRVAASVTRHRWALPGGRAELDLWFAEGRRIDPLLAQRAVTRDVVEKPVEEQAAPQMRLA